MNDANWQITQLTSTIMAEPRSPGGQPILKFLRWRSKLYLRPPDNRRLVITLIFRTQLKHQGAYFVIWNASICRILIKKILGCYPSTLSNGRRQLPLASSPHFNLCFLTLNMLIYPHICLDFILFLALFQWLDTLPPTRTHYRLIFKPKTYKGGGGIKLKINIC